MPEVFGPSLLQISRTQRASYRVNLNEVSPWRSKQTIPCVDSAPEYRLPLSPSVSQNCVTRLHTRLKFCQKVNNHEESYMHV